jgi:hypothetical protein
MRQRLKKVVRSLLEVPEAAGQILLFRIRPVLPDHPGSFTQADTPGIHKEWGMSGTKRSINKKRLQPLNRNPLFSLVGRAGLEPATNGLKIFFRGFHAMSLFAQLCQIILDNKDTWEHSPFTVTLREIEFFKGIVGTGWGLARPTDFLQSNPLVAGSSLVKWGQSGDRW